MSFLLDKKQEHETRCEEMIRQNRPGEAVFHAAKAAEFAYALADQTTGHVRERYLENAQGWLEIAEKIKAKPSLSQKPSPGIEKADGRQKSGREDPANEPDWLVAEKPNVTFEMIAGMQEAKDSIMEMVVVPLKSPEKARALGLKPGGGVLLYGPPGNGKTMLGKAIASQLDAPFYYASGAQIRSKWHGESEQRLRSLIQTAKAQPVAVLFFDEVEGLLPKRGEDSPVDNRIVTEFLAQIGGFEDNQNTLLILGATNNPWAIDEAVFRTGRFDEKIYIGLPDEPARLGMLKIHLGKIPHETGLDFSAWAARFDGYTGSDIVGIVNDAKRAALARAVKEDSSPLIRVSDLDAAFKAIPSSVTPELLDRYDKFKAPQRRGPLNPAVRKDGTNPAAGIRRGEAGTAVSAPAKSAGAVSEKKDSVEDNEEISFEILPDPEPDNALPLEILPDPPPVSGSVVSPETLKRLQAVIQDAARRLGRIELEPAGEPVVGMTSIRFSFNKAAGQSVSVTKVLDLAKDIGVETERSPVRIYIDSAINFELPLSEEERRFVPIKTLLTEVAGTEGSDSGVSYLIGRTQDGRPFSLSAHSVLHMLVGGSTGGGKSVLLHTIIWGLIFRYPPSKVRLALYDHKIEEFAPYRDLPHLWQPVVTNEGGYHRLIKNLKSEITRRKLARRDDPDAQFTWLIVVMDEFRGLSNDTFVALIAEARSLQIRFILGTQRAEKSFISTSIKANLPTGIAFRVRNQMESRLIIGEPDACNLLPHGDCIVHSPSEMERVQAGWVQKSDLKVLRAHLAERAVYKKGGQGARG